ncbi:hypothetical protein T12_11248 [Trichinella patagoniensis]|uniref:Uncharacterized protein n=1 Tax=Trichinella patagoniensis TaxID=990121 RepID=A0A0V1AGV8_9BILA|nr:hypothetical protein T12_11248 [Trichinella patagoniensis]
MTQKQISYIRSYIFGVLWSLSHNEGLRNYDLKQLAELCTDNKPTVIDSKEDISLRTNRILSKARRDVIEMISCYQEIRHERKHRKRQLTLDSFITKKSKVEESKTGLGSQPYCACMLWICRFSARLSPLMWFHTMTADEEKGDAANRKLAYCSTGLAIPDACSRLTIASASAGCMNRSGKYSWKLNICSSAGKHIPRMLRADSLFCLTLVFRERGMPLSFSEVNGSNIIAAIYFMTPWLQSS